MEQSNEQRKTRRYSVDGIHGNVLNATDLDILNMSVDGIAIESPRRLEVNREYTFRIESSGSSLNMRGRVVWAILISKKTKGSSSAVPVYRAGIKFTEMLSEKANTLLNFIEENRIKTPEQRLEGIRFRIENTDKVKLDYPYKYKVKKIGLSGMLIETEYRLDLDSRHSIELFIHNKRLNIVGRVVTCEKNDSEGDTYDVGVEFLTIPDEDDVILKGFLRTLV